MHWASLLGKERTDEELAKIRAENIAEFDIDKFTCDDCPARYTCEWAFDIYNTDGDCLADK